MEAYSNRTCGNRRSRVRLSGSPQTVWFCPGSQACTSPAGSRTPSGPVSSPEAATAGVLLILIRARFPHAHPPMPAAPVVATSVTAPVMATARLS